MNPFLAAQLLLRLLYNKLTRIFFLASQSASLPTLDNRAGGQMGRQANRRACRGGGVRHCQWNPSGQFVLLSIIGLTWLFAHPKQSRLVAFSTSSGSTMGYRGYSEIVGAIHKLSEHLPLDQEQIKCRIGNKKLSCY